MAEHNPLQLTLDLIKTMFPRAEESDIFKDDDGNLARLLSSTPHNRLYELKFNPEVFRDLVTKSYLIRLAIDQAEATLTPYGGFALAAEKQFLASEKCPEIVPPVLVCGVVENGGPEGKDLGYMVMPYADDVMPFSQELWEELGPAAQEGLMDEIVGAMQKYRFLGPPDDCINPSRLSADWEVYLPHLGAEKKHATMKDFFLGLVEADPRPEGEAAVRVVDTNAGGIEIVLEDASPFSLRHRVEFSAEELEDVHGYAVVCHNDLEPENVMVREVVDAVTGAKRYTLAAIINWEKAGIYPFAYEFAVKDFLLRLDQSWSWYRLFKSKTAAALLSDEPSTDKFIRAVWVILHAKCKSVRMSAELAGRMEETLAGKYLWAKTLLDIGERRGWLVE